MAPSTRTTAAGGATATAHQSNFYNFAKVSKVKVLQQLGKQQQQQQRGAAKAKSLSLKTIQALSEAVINSGSKSEAARPSPAPAAPGALVAPSSAKLKRKWSDEAETEDEEVATGSLGPVDNEKSLITKKRTKRSLAPTTTTTNVLLEEFRVIFQHFLSAFSLHLAHNGSSSPADIDSLLGTVTRLYKKRTVRRDDIQRMLALFELPIQQEQQQQQQQQHQVDAPDSKTLLLPQNKSPFRLVITGVGSGVRHLVEYCCSEKVYDERRLVEEYDQVIASAGADAATIEQRPRLAYIKGSQTVLRQERASAVRNHILNIGRPGQNQSRLASTTTTTEPDLSRLSISGPDTSMTGAEDATSRASSLPTSSTKSRTLSLFDRIKSKQNAALLQPSPSSSQLLYRHALGRIGDVVEILRMKQNQRTVLAASTCNKLTMSMSQAVSTVKGSLATPMGDGEIQLCFKILAEDVEGMSEWLKVVEMGGFQSVVIQGRCSMRGDEIRNVLMKKQQGQSQSW